MKEINIRDFLQFKENENIVRINDESVQVLQFPGKNIGSYTINFRWPNDSTRLVEIYGDLDELQEMFNYPAKQNDN